MIMAANPDEPLDHNEPIDKELILKEFFPTGQKATPEEFVYFVLSKLKVLCEQNNHYFNFRPFSDKNKFFSVSISIDKHAEFALKVVSILIHSGCLSLISYGETPERHLFACRLFG